MESRRLWWKGHVSRTGEVANTYNISKDNFKTHVFMRVTIEKYGFIDHLYTPFGTTNNYSAIVNHHSTR
jgi:hypothetical protein